MCGDVVQESEEVGSNRNVLTLVLQRDLRTKGPQKSSH